MPIEAVYILGIIMIAGAMAYGVLRSRDRNKANDPIREEAVRQSYDEPDRYAQGGREQLQRQLEPEK